MLLKKTWTKTNLLRFQNLHDTGNNIPKENTKRDCNMYASKYIAAKIIIIEIIGWFFLNCAAAIFSLVI